MLRWLRRTWKGVICKFMVIIEYCHDCGIEQPVVWTADDDLWMLVNGSPYGVLCPRCFGIRAEKMGLFLRWKPTVESAAGGGTEQFSLAAYDRLMGELP